MYQGAVESFCRGREQAAPGQALKGNEMKDNDFFRLVNRTKILIEGGDDGILDVLEEENPDATPSELMEVVDEAERQLAR